MTRYLTIRVQLWVVAVAAVLAIIGLVVCINIISDGMAYESAKAAILVGLIIWTLVALSIWGYQAMSAAQAQGLQTRPFVEVEIEPVAQEE